MRVACDWFQDMVIEVVVGRAEVLRDPLKLCRPLGSMIVATLVEWQRWWNGAIICWPFSLPSAVLFLELFS